ncbi:HlyD family efflux transporter periplasmic adaptor subunit [Brucella intermedia]|uniref:Adhesin transport system membrane fusion protein n=4 Tax=Brucella intermedia TaxID=94625 RepID=A0ABR6AVB0_9HYPH|nr:MULTISPECIES: HlyD family efflux transporter periplasmic adaptor subunit [Brucella/Ochrobactrum group]KAB2669951.1 HlyD family efflux transporter periplasmic adaptor subunit [Ochrobactrum sp. LMG 5442]PJT25007.1 secretion protein HlyD [Ochrobactrum sp. 30A/1000/2015]PJT40457.1 secretion protein HlyD [Ochrobactrum sp. 27A/999/2015]PJT42909.1 secretion protein HlyD [Ochrobactrum sp. 23A/997/2015]EEQ94383.1 type I secretion membrane fusion protein, HlyD family [Brucella intermedia LMG 3301]
MAALGEDFGDWVNGSVDGARLKRSKRFVRLVFLFFAVLLIWAYLALLDEVSTGTGKVVPTSQEQVIQSLEGGVLAKLYVRQDDVVEPGKILAQLDPTVTEATVQESSAKYRAALASSARLTAEVNGSDLEFPDELDAFPSLQASETKLYEARKRSLKESLDWLAESKKLAQDELAISQSLTKMGAASNVEVIRLKRQLVELQLKETEIQSDYIVKAREELAKANADVESLSSVIRGRADSLARLTLRSPVRGIVKNIEVSTIGGVVPPNGKLMIIVPLDEQLLIEARISPRDIAYIHPDQPATVKVTAYDYAIYGSLKGKVVSISPDTIQDEVKPEEFYYRVFIKTETDALFNKTGERFPIVPGMVATVDIHTGSKTVMDYLIKPFNRAREALRER